jgi:hypothetical protein
MNGIDEVFSGEDYMCVQLEIMKNVEKMPNMNENEFCFRYSCDCFDIWKFVSRRSIITMINVFIV